MSPTEYWAEAAVWPHASSDVGSADREAPGSSQNCEVTGLCPQGTEHLYPSLPPRFTAPSSRIALETPTAHSVNVRTEGGRVCNSLSKAHTALPHHLTALLTFSHPLEQNALVHVPRPWVPCIKIPMSLKGLPPFGKSLLWQSRGWVEEGNGFCLPGTCNISIGVNTQ